MNRKLLIALSTATMIPTTRAQVAPENRKKHGGR
jgi:hypothetical protein